MNAESRLNGRCETCLSKNVQVVLNCEPLGQNRSKLFLRIASKHTSHSICAFLSKWCQECPSSLSNCPSGCPQKCPSACPSGLLDLEGYVMETGVELLWLPAARLAQIYGKSVKTIRRMIDEGVYIAVRRTVKSGSYRTTKLFVLVDQQIVDLDQQLCRKLRQEPIPLRKERMLIEDHEHTSLFIVSYNKVKKQEAQGGQN